MLAQFIKIPCCACGWPYFFLGKSKQNRFAAENSPSLPQTTRRRVPAPQHLPSLLTPPLKKPVGGF
jgi:hypothetical protein